MKNIFKAFLFKLKKDLSFRIIGIIGLALAVLLPTILFLIDLGISQLNDDGKITHMLCTGQSLLVSSWSPTQNFGLAIPITLITLTVLEFTNGTIRNKVISGYSKTKIYLGLYFTGLLYTLALISVYVLVCFGLGCAFGGFNPRGELFSLSSLGGGSITPDFLWKVIFLSLLAYVVIATMTIFFSTLFRNIGPSIPVVIILIVMCSGLASISQVLSLFGSDTEEATSMAKLLSGVGSFLKAINPIHSILVFDSTTTTEMINGQLESTTTMGISWTSFWTQIANNLVYIAAFFTGGLFIFRKRDIK